MATNTDQSPASSPDHPPPPAETSPPLSSTGPLIVWLGIQLTVLVLVVARVPLAAKYPDPAERLALHLMFATQIVAATLLFPFLLRDWRTTMQIIATALPFQLATAYLAGIELKSSLDGAAVVVLWILAMGIWRNVLHSRAAQHLAVAIASCVTIGGAIVSYLRLEFAPDSSSISVIENASPLFTTLISIENTPTWIGWFSPIAILIFGVIVCVAKRVRRTR